jgi:hypothetical protein
MTGVYFQTNKQMTESIINMDPVEFIKNVSDYIQNLGYIQNFDFEVKMSPYRNRVLRLLDHAANYFWPKSIDLKDLDGVKKYHSKGHPLKFNSREIILFKATRPTGTIVFKFAINNNPFRIEVYNDKVEIHDLTSKEENEEFHNLCETLLCGPFRELYVE